MFTLVLFISVSAASLMVEPQCLAHNNVPQRGDNYAASLPVARQYSVLPTSFAQNNSFACSSVSELLATLRYGSRVWESDSLDNAVPKYIRPSSFVPQSCAIEVFAPSDICKILQNFSQIVLVGDSLTRHMFNAMMMLLSNDFVNGAVGGPAIRGQPDVCKCDGQFSELKACRTTRGTPRLLCPVVFQTVARRVQTDIKVDPNTISPVSIRCHENDKPFVVVLQAHAHIMRTSHFDTGTSNNIASVTAMWILDRVVRPVFAQITAAKRTCKNDYHVFFLGPGIQASILDEKYPTQRAAVSIELSRILEHELRTAFPEILYIDFLNITKDSPTSDGFHYLSDVNIAKDFILLQILKLISISAQN